MEDKIDTQIGEVMIRETTLRQLLDIVEKVKDEVQFTDAPMPFGDMSRNMKLMEEIKRGKLTVASLNSSVSFQIRLDIGGLINRPEPGGDSLPLHNYTLQGSLPEKKKPRCSICNDTGVIRTSAGGHAQSFVRCDHGVKRMKAEQILETMEKNMDGAEATLAASNLYKDPIKVKHSELESSPGDSIFKKECPVCHVGMLLVTRDPTTRELLPDDNCIYCGQHFIYTDIEELKIETGESKSPPEEQPKDESKSIAYMDIKEFREFGLLQEANRQFFHPIGLALEVNIDDETGKETLGKIWDYRNDPEGMVYYEIDKKKMDRVKTLQKDKWEERRRETGYIVQPCCEICKDRGTVLLDVDSLGGTATRYINCPKCCGDNHG